VTERQNLVTLFSNVQTKLKTYGLREYVAPKGLSLLDLDNAWKHLLKSEADWSRKINDEIRRFDFLSLSSISSDILLSIKEELRKKFARLANDFEQKLRSISMELTNMEGALEVMDDCNSVCLPNTS